MVKKSLILTLLLLIGHYSITYFFEPLESKSNRNNQWDRNMLKVEDFVYEKNKGKDIIIVGSSMSQVLVEDSLSNRFANLAVAGQSIYEGLEILLQLNYQPKVLIIEINLINKKIKNDFINSLFLYGTYPYLKNTNIFRTKNKPEFYIDVPVNELIVKPLNDKIINKVLYKILNPIDKLLNIKEKKEQKDNTELRDIMIQSKLDEYKHIVEYDEVTSRLKYLDKYIEHFSSLGTQIIFIELPEDKVICKTEWTDLRDSIITKRYQNDNIHYLFNPNCDNYTTSDAVHMTRESAMRYCEELINKTSSVIGQKN